MRIPPNQGVKGQEAEHPKSEAKHKSSASAISTPAAPPFCVSKFPAASLAQAKALVTVSRVSVRNSSDCCSRRSAVVQPPRTLCECASQVLAPPLRNNRNRTARQRSGL